MGPTTVIFYIIYWNNGEDFVVVNLVHLGANSHQEQKRLYQAGILHSSF